MAEKRVNTGRLTVSIADFIDYHMELRPVVVCHPDPCSG